MHWFKIFISHVIVTQSSWCMQVTVETFSCYYKVKLGGSIQYHILCRSLSRCYNKSASFIVTYSVFKRLRMYWRWLANGYKQLSLCRFLLESSLKYYPPCSSWFQLETLETCATFTTQTPVLNSNHTLLPAMVWETITITKSSGHMSCSSVLRWRFYH